MPLHVFTSAVGHVLVEAPQQDGPYHDGDVEPEAGQKAATLQSHIGRSNHQSFPRAVRQREEVITVKNKTNKQKQGEVKAGFCAASFAYKEFSRCDTCFC